MQLSKNTDETIIASSLIDIKQEHPKVIKDQAVISTSAIEKAAAKPEVESK
jgi:hypothetical protein